MDNRNLLVGLYNEDNTYRFGWGHSVRMRALGSALELLGVKVQYKPSRHVDLPDIAVLDYCSKDRFDWEAVPRGSKTVFLVAAGHEIIGDVVAAHDLVVYQGPDCLVPQSLIQRYRSKILRGFENVILRPEFARPPTTTKRSGVAVYFGNGVPVPFELAVFTDLNDRCGRNVYRVAGTGGAVVDILDQVTAFVGTMGMVAYEAIARGLRPYLYSVDQDHHSTVAALASLGLAIDLGFVDTKHVPEFPLVPLRGGLLPDSSPIDGGGATRVAKRILETRDEW